MKKKFNFIGLIFLICFVSNISLSNHDNVNDDNIIGTNISCTTGWDLFGVFIEDEKIARYYFLNYKEDYGVQKRWGLYHTSPRFVSIDHAKTWEFFKINRRTLEIEFTSNSNYLGTKDNLDFKSKSFTCRLLGEEVNLLKEYENMWKAYAKEASKENLF